MPVPPQSTKVQQLSTTGLGDGQKRPKAAVGQKQPNRMRQGNQGQFASVKPPSSGVMHSIFPKGHLASECPVRMDVDAVFYLGSSAPH